MVRIVRCDSGVVDSRVASTATGTVSILRERHEYMSGALIIKVPICKDTHERASSFYIEGDIPFMGANCAD